MQWVFNLTFVIQGINLQVITKRRTSRFSALKTISHKSTMASNKIGMLIKILLWLICCALPHAYADELTDNRSRDENRTYHLYDDINMIATIDVSYDKPRIIYHAVYPQLRSETENVAANAFNLMVSDIVQEEMAHFKIVVQQFQNTPINLPKEKIRHDLYIDYDTSFINTKHHHIASIRFTFQGLISGRTEPYRYHRVLNYDLSDNTPLTLADLFEPDANYLSVLSHYTQNALIKKFGYKQMILYGTASNIENFQNWNIKPNGILITFDQQQIAASVEGAQTVLVPFSVLRDMISEDSPIVTCISKRRCKRNNVLTGGFIDEAINTRNLSLNPILS